MKISTKQLSMLRKALPPGSGITIKLRLEKQNHIFSLSYIYRVLDPKNPDYNTLIIDEAISYLEELSSQKTSREKRIEAIVTN